MQNNPLANLLNQEIKHTSQVFVAFLCGVVFAVAGLVFMALHHIMHKAVGVCIVAMVVFGFAALHYATDMLRLRRLRNSTVLDKPEELKSMRFSYQVKAREFVPARDAVIPSTAKNVQLQLEKRNGESHNMKLPVGYVMKLQQAIKLHFPGISLF